MEKEKIEEVLAKMYDEFENNKKPFSYNIQEDFYNDGFYQGRLTAIEKITQELLGMGGDELKARN